MPDSFSQTGEGLLLIANGIDPVLRWAGEGDMADPAGLDYPATAVSGTGSGTGSLVGTYYAYVTFLRNDGFESSMSPISSAIILNNHLQIDYTALPVSTDPRVVGRRIYRNTNGQVRTVYLDVTVNNNIDTTATGTLSDSILQSGLAFPLYDDRNRLQTHDSDPPPDTKPFVCNHLGRTYYFGHADYSEGSCEVTLGSTVVQGRGTRWRANWGTRFLYVDGGNKVYEIESVDETLQQITLTETFTGATNLFAGYTVRPSPGECAAMYYSEVNEPEKVAPDRAIAVPQEDDVGTGLMSMYGFLYVLKRKSIFRFTVGRDPAKDGALYPANSRGCVNQRCVIVVSDVAYMLDERGAYRFSGGQDAQDISVQVQDFFQDGSDTPINWSAARYFHGSHSPAESTIRWFVALRGDLFPRHALCYCYTLNHWWTEPYHRPVAASCLGLSGRTATGWGRSLEQVYYGLDGEIMAPTQAAPDVVSSPVAQTFEVVEATINSVTFAGQASADMVGAAVVHRSKFNNLQGYLQTRRIVAASGNTLTVHPPWGRIPSAEDEVVPGGFAWQYRTHDYRYATKEENSERSLEVIFQPNLGSFMDIEVSHNDLTQTNNADISSAANGGVEYAKNRKAIRADLKHDNGSAGCRFDGLLEDTTDGRKRVGVVLTGIGGNGKDRIQQIIVKGAVA